MNKLKQINENYWFYPVTDFVYDEDYANKYKAYADTPMGRDLLEARLNAIRPESKLLDIGVGCCTVIDAVPGSMGYDVNPSTVKKLYQEYRWYNPYMQNMKEFSVITFFDSFEHVEKPEELLNRITHQKVVIAIPIFKSYDDVLSSKHYRPDEHFHYFTMTGFITYMESHGFELKSLSDIEIELGREAIYTFTFKRRSK